MMLIAVILGAGGRHVHVPAGRASSCATGSPYRTASSACCRWPPPPCWPRWRPRRRSTDAGGFAGIARPAGVAVGALLAWRRAPFVVVVVAAAATAALLRLAGVD